jgi:hypothetical protein
VDGTGSRLCPVMCFGINDESFSSATSVYVVVNRV